MTTWKTPGLWNDIPVGSKIRATRAAVTLEGEMVGLRPGPVTHSKILVVKVAPFADALKLDSRDQWGVEYESLSQADVMGAAPVGTVWVDRRDGWPRLVKVAEKSITLQKNPHTTDGAISVHLISDIGSDPDAWLQVPLNLLREQAGV